MGKIASLVSGNWYLPLYMWWVGSNVKIGFGFFTSRDWCGGEARPTPCGIALVMRWADRLNLLARSANVKEPPV